jgi:FlaA1/EpsC-like NDP-sugar epimerase
MIDRSLKPLFDLPRAAKAGIQMVADFFLLSAAFALAMNLRVDNWAFLANAEFVSLGLAMASAAVVIMYALGVYRSVIRYLSSRIIPLLMWSIFGAGVFLFLSSQLLGIFVPRSVPVIFMMLAFLMMAGLRYAFRAVYLSRQMKLRRPVIIYGAGESGRQLLASLNRGSHDLPVVFVDDDRSLQGSIIEGLRVRPPEALPQLIERWSVSTVLLAIPSATPKRRREIISMIEPLSVQVQTIPGLSDLISGRAKINEIRSVSIEELLGREAVNPDPALLSANITGRSVLVTGAGGSIGSELSEFALYAIDQDLRDRTSIASNCEIVPVLGSVLDRALVEATLKAHSVETIYHAAAYKHVPLVEANAVEGLRNNVFGTRIVAEAACACGVQSFILISTDKAVRPTNVMGASKRIAELVCQSYAGTACQTRFSMVRFGNVLGSSGSVVPLFEKQIARGGPVTVTHPEVTRYFMTIPEAAQLVIQAGAMGQGGEVFVLDMGEPVLIADLAARMVRLSGFKPVWAPAVAENAGEITIEFTGLRPGEKLYEELLISGDVLATRHPRIMKATEIRLSAKEMATLLSRLSALLAAGHEPETRRFLSSINIGYDPAAG